MNGAGKRVLFHLTKYSLSSFRVPGSVPGTVKREMSRMQDLTTCKLHYNALLRETQTKSWNFWNDVWILSLRIFSTLKIVG